MTRYIYGALAAGGQLAAGSTRVELRLMLQKRHVMIAKHHDLQISGVYHILVRPWTGARAPERALLILPGTRVKRVKLKVICESKYLRNKKSPILRNPSGLSASRTSRALRDGTG